MLYSVSGAKSYVGFTNDLKRRLFEHNVSEKTGFTLRYRPWLLIHEEAFDDKATAIKREKFLKSGVGREEVKGIIEGYLVRYPPKAEKD